MITESCLSGRACTNRQLPSLLALVLGTLLALAVQASTGPVQYTGRLLVLTAAHTSGDALYGDGASYYLRVPLELLPVPETLDDIWGQGTYARAQASGGQETILNLYFAEGAEPAAGILRSGDRVRAVVDTWPSDIERKPGFIYVTQLGAISQGGTGGQYPAYYDGSGPYDFSSITFVVDNLCGYRNILKAADVRQQFFGPSPPPPTPPKPPGSKQRMPVVMMPADPKKDMPMSTYWQNCTFNQMTFKPERNLVLNVSIPCKGFRARDGAPWGADTAAGLTCSATDLLGWVDYAEAAAEKALGYPLQRHLRRVLVLPGSLSACAWTRKGTLGCDVVSGCASWIKGAAGQFLKHYAHEWGHTMSLQHANGMLDPNPITQQVIPLGDPTCVMGTTAGKPGARCFSSYAAWRLGYESPLAAYGGSESWDDGQSFEGLYGNFYTVHQLPPAGSSRQNIVKLRNSWLNNIDPAEFRNFFIQYRTNAGGDKLMNNSFVNKVLVHRATGTASKIIGDESEIVAAIPVGGLYRSVSGSFVVRFDGMVDGQAQISMCVFSTPLEGLDTYDCGDGLDNDCSGAADDGACIPFDDGSGDGYGGGDGGGPLIGRRRTQEEHDAMVQHALKDSAGHKFARRPDFEALAARRQQLQDQGQGQGVGQQRQGRVELETGAQRQRQVTLSRKLAL